MTVQSMSEFQSAPGSMSRENCQGWVFPASEDVSIRSRLDEPGERADRRPAGIGREVSIRSRLDEPGELVRRSGATAVFVFQSAPGSMSRENPTKPRTGRSNRSFNPLPAR